MTLATTSLKKEAQHSKPLETSSDIALSLQNDAKKIIESFLEQVKPQIEKLSQDNKTLNLDKEGKRNKFFAIRDLTSSFETIKSSLCYDSNRFSEVTSDTVGALLRFRDSVNLYNQKYAGNDKITLEAPNSVIGGLVESGIARLEARYNEWLSMPEQGTSSEAQKFFSLTKKQVERLSLMFIGLRTQNRSLVAEIERGEINIVSKEQGAKEAFLSKLKEFCDYSYNGTLTPLELNKNLQENTASLIRLNNLLTSSTTFNSKIHDTEGLRNHRNALFEIYNLVRVWGSSGNALGQTISKHKEVLNSDTVSSSFEKPITEFANSIEPVRKAIIDNLLNNSEAIRNIAKGEEMRLLFEACPELKEKYRKESKILDYIITNNDLKLGIKETLQTKLIDSNQQELSVDSVIYKSKNLKDLKLILTNLSQFSLSDRDFSIGRNTNKLKASFNTLNKFKDSPDISEIERAAVLKLLKNQSLYEDLAKIHKEIIKEESEAAESEKQREQEKQLKLTEQTSSAVSNPVPASEDLVEPENPEQKPSIWARALNFCREFILNGIFARGSITGNSSQAVEEVVTDSLVTEESKVLNLDSLDLSNQPNLHEADDIINLSEVSFTGDQPANEDKTENNPITASSKTPELPNQSTPILSPTEVEEVKFIKEKIDKFTNLLNSFPKVLNTLSEMESVATSAIKEYLPKVRQVTRIVDGLFKEAQNYRKQNPEETKTLPDQSTSENIEKRKQIISENQKFFYSAVPDYVDVKRLFTLSTLRDKLNDSYPNAQIEKDQFGREIRKIDDDTSITSRDNNQLTFSKDGKKLKFEHRRDGQVTVYLTNEKGEFEKTGTLWMYDAEQLAKRFLDGRDLGIKGKRPPATVYKIPDPKVFE